MNTATTGPPARTNQIGAICACVLCAIAIAGLWPFNPFPRNDVRWLTNQNGLNFGPTGIAYSLPAPQRTDSPNAATCTLEIWLRPDRNSGINDILTFYSPQAPRQLTLFEWKESTLLLYSDSRVEHREIDVADAFHPGTPLLVTITAGPHNTSVYLNGALAQVSSELRLSEGDFSNQLILGTSLVTNNAWSGELRGIAIYGKELTGAQVSQHFVTWSSGGGPATGTDDSPITFYAFSEHAGRIVHDRVGAGPDIYIPEHYLIPYKTILLAPWKDFRRNSNEIRDVATNIAGFVVAGFFLYAYLMLRSCTKHTALVTILSGAAISLTIEILQAYLPTRTSSMTDVMMNIFGTALGVVLCKTATAQGFLAGRRAEKSA